MERAETPAATAAQSLSMPLWPCASRASELTGETPVFHLLLRHAAAARSEHQRVSVVTFADGGHFSRAPTSALAELNFFLAGALAILLKARYCVE